MTRNAKLGAILTFCLGAMVLPGPTLAGLWSYRLPDPLLEGSPIDSSWRQSDVPQAWVFERVGPTGNLGPAQRDPDVSIDPIAGQVHEIYSEGGVETRIPLVATMEDYSSLVSQRNYRRLWLAQSRQSRSLVRGTAKRPTGLFHVDIPVQIPKQLRGILGSGVPNIDVSGSETITLSGISDWTVQKNQQDTERKRPSAFPSLEMKQDLQVNLTGSIGDKVRIDLDQSSNVQTSLDNKVKLRYEGDDDDMIKSIDLGNTNLSLAGASFRQEGLFGIKTAAKLGTVDVVAIVSKQEGKSETSRFTPSGEKRRISVSDLAYIPRQYFFINDSSMVWDAGTLRVFRDNLNGSDNTLETRGRVRIDPTQPADSTNNPEVIGSFRELTQGIDYQIIRPYLISGGTAGEEIPVIKFLNQIGSLEVIAVAYVQIVGGVAQSIGQGSKSEVLTADPALGKEAGEALLKMIKPTTLATDAGGRFSTSDPWYPTLSYELRNFYDLTARNIAIETLNLVVRRRDTSQSVDPDGIDGVPLIKILGLDQQGTLTGSPPDGKIDAQFLDQETGILFFPDLHPFDPVTTAGPGCGLNRGGFLCLDDFGRNTLRGDSTNPSVYYVKTPDPYTQSRYYIDAEFKSSQQGYFIGRYNLLENSEQVKVDGILNKRGVDYNLDYETGQLTFSRPPGPEQVITVDYSFAPGAGQVQRTLMGLSTSYSPSTDLSLSSSILVESRGAQDLNPKLGEEPARSMVGDFAGVVAFRPRWMTNLTNMVPGVHTSVQSALNLQGNAAVSLPNPNTSGEAYLDDMEGNRESSTLTLSRTQWMWSSVPFEFDSTGGSTEWSTLVGDHALVEWYNARGVKERDLKPALTDAEGGDNEHTVLELNAVAPSGGAPFTPLTWTGVTQSISRSGEDLSRTRYIDVWINDHRALNHSATKARLHIDFGRVSEDAYWQEDNFPNDKLDTEDKNLDTRLDADEDTGLDGVPDDQEPGWDPQSNLDPNGDDYQYSLAAPADYSKINGTEKNSQGKADARPDTEDLNQNGQLDQENDFFEATIDLADTAFVAIDVARDYPGYPSVTPSNGWRLFRIPLNSPTFLVRGSPNWDTIKHARIWLSDMGGPTNIQVGGVELVGNRWLTTATTAEQQNRGVRISVGVVNNKDDAAVYQPPFQVDNAAGSSAAQREQSLKLNFHHLEPVSPIGYADTVFTFRAFSNDGSGVGYTQYRELAFYLRGVLGVDTSLGLRAVARFGPDTVNYYEYSLPVSSAWQEVHVPMETLSRLKESSTSRVRIDSLTSAAEGVRYTVVGNPSFTRVSRISFGLTAFGGTTIDTGEVWIDDLRLIDVRKESGTAGNFSIQANFADLMALNVAYQKQDQDFFRVGAGVNRGSGLNHTALGVSTTLQLDRIFPASGLQLPVRVSLQKSTDIPKYRTGSDVVLDPSRSDLETRRSERQTIDLSYRRIGPRQGFTKYTVDALSGSLAYSRAGSADPQSRDSSWAFVAAGGYDLPIGGGKAIRLPGAGRFKYLPEVLSFSSAWNSSRATSYARRLGATTDTTVLRSNVLTRLLTLGVSTSWLPLTSVTTRFGVTSKRNMLIRQEGPLGWNKGVEVDRTQRMELNWTPRRFLLLTPNVGLVGLYHEDARPELRLSQSDPQGLKNIDNRGSARITTTFPLARFAQRFKRAPAAGGTKGASQIAVPFRKVFGLLQDVQTSFTLERSSSATRVVGDPGFAYKTGFTQAIGTSLTRTTNSTVANNRRYLSSATTNLQPFERLNVDVRADHQVAYTDATFGARRVVSLSWPDLNGRWQELQRSLGLGGTFTSLALTSHYSRKQDDQGPQGKPVETSAIARNWAPLLGWNATFKNGIRADVTTAIAKAETRDERAIGFARFRMTKNSDIRLTKTYPASKGIKFPWSKHRVRLPNDVNLNLSMGIAHDQQRTEREGIPPLVEQDIQRLNVGSGTSYNFTPAVTGGFDLAYRQSKDNKLAVTQRGITIAVNAQFRF